MRKWAIHLNTAEIIRQYTERLNNLLEDSKSATMNQCVNGKAVAAIAQKWQTNKPGKEDNHERDRKRNWRTLAAISGPMAYAYYKTMPEELIGNAKKKLPQWMLEVNDEMDNVRGKN